jgi:hypothetical protein
MKEATEAQVGAKGVDEGLCESTLTDRREANPFQPLDATQIAEQRGQTVLDSQVQPPLSQVDSGQHHFTEPCCSQTPRFLEHRAMIATAR